MKYSAPYFTQVFKIQPRGQLEKVTTWEIAVIGAGLAGLSCAQRLAQAGYQVGIVEKSRGLGGRLASRRLHQTQADHGARSLQPQTDLLRSLIAALTELDLLQPWQAQSYIWQNQQLTVSPDQTHYVAPQGITAVAKFLATGLTIHRQCRAVSLSPVAAGWQIQAQAGDAIASFSAHTVILAIPAPQALDLLKSLPPEVLDQQGIASLSHITYHPCFSVMAGYPASQSDRSQSLFPAGWQIDFVGDSDSELLWLGLESSKRSGSDRPLVVAQSGAAFAQAHLETTDLTQVGQTLLQAAAAKLLWPWLSQPDWLQVQRWRYAFVDRGSSEPVLQLAQTPQLLSCGDGWASSGIAAALQSGFAAAARFNQQSQQRSLLSMSALCQRLQ
ncbi:MAG: NAD(P)-binding protein [Leptolyngbya sp. SIO4C5]|nr:NAD(P)-binding protein [Leptolyngbya sp. SIO4C5]